MLSPTEPSGRFPHLHGRGTIYDTHGFEWTFLLKFLCTKIVQQFVFLVQSIVLVVRKLRERENRPDQLGMRMAYRLPPLLRTDVRKQ